MTKQYHCPLCDTTWDEDETEATDALTPIPVSTACPDCEGEQ